MKYWNSEAMDHTQTYVKFKHLKNDWTSFEDDERSGHSSIGNTKANIDKIHEIIHKNHLQAIMILNKHIGFG